MKWVLQPFLWLLAHSPIWAMKGISTFVSWLNWYVIGYRKKVVMENLQKVFPYKTEKERKKIARKFYTQLLDYILAVIRQRYNKAPVLNKFIFHKNPELLNTLHKQGKSTILVAGHYFTWEYVNTTPYICNFLVAAAYSPLSNKFADNLMKFTRQKYGVIIYPSNEIYRALAKYSQEKIPTMTLMVADQSPVIDNLKHWITFLGQDTPVLTGIEHIAKKLNQAVVFLKITQRERFVYEYEYVLITDNPTAEQSMQITKRWFAELEKKIYWQPELYLWSHRRWKYKRPEDMLCLAINN